MSKSNRRQVRPLTPPQMEILTFIRDYQHSHGYSPTMQELADARGVSKVTVFEHIEALVEKGLLRRLRHKARSLEITSRAQFPDDRPTLIPIGGRIAAGSPIEAVEGTEHLDLESLFVTPHERFVLEVQGDSMIDDHIRSGDFVVVEKRPQVRNGDTVVAVLPGGDATLKKFYRERNGVRLQPANSAYKPIHVKEVDIQGVVIGVVRQC
ncbi:MAG: transcriptional repressor LexA [Phycisphaerales bacterium]|nr:transcriptional repressor LexA [Phycisphaerales bacterium]